MAMMFGALSERHIEFIRAQKIYFTGTATAGSRVNVSPKGMDSLRVLGPNRVAWLSVTGSGNETSAHVQADARMTVMFCAFEGAPLILRLYGTAKVIHRNDPEWPALFPLFPPLPGARQIFDLAIAHVQTSCGMGVPLMDYKGERGALEAWAEKKGESGLQDYWALKNQNSIDGLPTHIVARNAG
ncbi:MAG: pyridoxamine 5'-phosphate oxidase family protein [Burkholderiales bacterium]|nr:pyridoxamine 5'-phosphate oxidase family protein [Burkholderiales bacterium]